MNKKNIFLVLIILICIADLLTLISWNGFQYSFGSYLIASCRYLSVFLIYKLYNNNVLSKLLSTKIYYLFSLYLFWILLILILGLFKSDNYWDYKILFFDNLLYFLAPISIIIGLNLNYFLSFSRVIFLFFFPMGFLLIPFSLQTNQEVYSRLMSPVSLFIIFLPFLKLRNKVLVFLVISCSLATAISFRANVLKLLLCLLIVLTYHLKNYINIRFYKNLVISFYTAPFIFLILGITNTFNVFNNSLDEDKFSVKTANFENESLVGDTRSFLYREVLSSMNQNNSFLFGEGAIGKYKTDSFAGLMSVHDKYRNSCEVGILNLLLWTGILGVFLFLCLLYNVSKFGIINSNNILCKFASVYISCHWFMMFLEEFSLFDFNNIVFWISIGIVSSKKFCSLSDNEIASMFLDFKMIRTI